MAPPSTAKQTSAAAMARRKKGGGGLGQHARSLALLALAVGITYFFSSSPAAPKAPIAEVQKSAVPPMGQPPRQEEQPPRQESAECASWVRDGECASNEALMEKFCPRSCAAEAEKKRLAEQTAKAAGTAYDGPPDEADNCRAWAAAGECAQNAVYMLQKCAHALAPCPPPSRRALCPKRVRKAIRYLKPHC
jgi:hypothetical protein